MKRKTSRRFIPCTLQHPTYFPLHTQHTTRTERDQVVRKRCSEQESNVGEKRTKKGEERVTTWVKEREERHDIHTE